MERFITHRYKASDELKFHRYPFTVTDDITQIELDILNTSKINGIDIALESPSGFKGWSGGTLSKIFIGEEMSSEGYFSGIESGQWHLVIGHAKLFEDGVVDVAITLLGDEKRWYAGDLHIHSLHSDGVYEVQKIMEYAVDAGLEFIALTDHNSMKGHLDIAQKDKLIVIPGVEITTYRGHMNIWNLKEPLPNMLISTENELINSLYDAPQDTVFSINHPFFKDHWQFSFDVPFTHMEVWNAYWCGGNQMAVDWWHNELKKGKRIVAVGGSDTHRSEPKKWFGTPTTMVYSKSQTSSGILEGIKQGRVCVTQSSEAPYVDISYEGVVMGEVSSCSIEGVLDVIVYNPESCRLNVYTEQGKYTSFNIDDKQSNYSVNVIAEVFVRVELRDSETNEMLAISNPVYIRRNVAK